MLFGGRVYVLEDDSRMVGVEGGGGGQGVRCTKTDHYLSFLSGINLNSQ